MDNTKKHRLSLTILVILLLSFMLTLSYSQETQTDSKQDAVETMEEMTITHSILSDRSEASFSIFEILLGNDKTVIGTTSLVTGDLSFDINNPQATQLGPIMIDARGFETDDRRRNGAIQRRVLNTSQAANEFISFETTAIEGLPESIAVGESFNLMITGDLTLVGTTLEEVFTVTVTVNSETELEGVGTATIMHKNYALNIPNVPVVSFVADELILEIAFVAGEPIATEPVTTE